LGSLKVEEKTLLEAEIEDEVPFDKEKNWLLIGVQISLS
jgi:hypothetical protein